MGLKRRVVCAVKTFTNPFAFVCINLVLTTCSDSGTPPKIEAYTYSSTQASVNCEPGARVDHAGTIDGELSTDGICYNVRTPTNYDATVAHHLRMVYSTGGQSRWVSE